MGQSGVSEAGGHVFVPQTPEAFAYDDDGNLLSDGRWAYTWDAENRLTRMEPVISPAHPASAVASIEYHYDYQSRRTRMKVLGADNTPLSDVGYAWDGWTLAAEFSPDNGAALRRYMWNPGRGHRSLASVRLGTGTGTASPHAQFAIVDANANVSVLLNGASGAAAGGGAPEMSAVYEYCPFGEPLRATGPLAKANPIRFSSELLDPTTEFYYYGYRYYNPDTGRWLSRDPLGDEAFFKYHARGKSQEIIDDLKEESRKPAYVFLKNDGINKSDFLGLAYFAYRPLGGVLGWLGVKGNDLDDILNTVISHEQLFFEDGKSPSNIGYFDDRTLKSESNASGYQAAHDSGWNDCVMRKAIKNVPLQTYCLLGKLGKTEKFNCQDWAEAVRREYRKLIQDSPVVSICCPTDAEKNK